MDDNELATARLQMLQVPPNFCKTSRAAKMFVFLVVSLLIKGEKLQPSPGKLVVRSEVDGNDQGRWSKGSNCSPKYISEEQRSPNILQALFCIYRIAKEYYLCLL